MKLIGLSSNRMASCSYDKTIKIWKSIPPYNQLKTLACKNWVESIIETNTKQYLISGSNSKDSSIIKWNLKTYQRDAVFNGVECFSSNSLVEINDNRILVGGKIKISVINILTDKVEKFVVNNELKNVISFLQLYENIFLCGNELGNGDFCVYDILENKITFHKKKIGINQFYLKIKQNHFIFGDFNGYIREWEY